MTLSPKRRLAALCVAALAVAGLSAVAPAATGQGNPHAVHAASRVHWAQGKALGARSDQGADAAVRGYLKRSLGQTTADSLRGASKWTVRGVTFLRLQQYAAGLPVAGSDVKAALDAQGRPVSVIENASAVSTPKAARVSSDRARAAAIDAIYHGRATGWYQQPTVARVAVPMSDGSLDTGYLVTTWDDDNQLWETVVDGDGAVVSSELRTAADGYNVFPTDPGKGGQVLISNPADPISSSAGWLSGTQYVDRISGNNVKAYVDADANNKPDTPGAVDGNGVFDKTFDATIQPSAGDNKAVAVQNLFYLNNLIHDTLDRAGFTPAAGNFQADNLGRGGRGNDPVLAEAQDGSGVDNANFAAPSDGKSGRMQMYLWTVPGEIEVVQGNSSYQAAGAEFGPPLTSTGVTGPLAVASPADACAPVAAVPAGAVVIADRGGCDFATKAQNVAAAGAAGMVVANNQAGAPFTMGGTIRRFSMPSVMVSQADGTTLKAGVGVATTMRLSTPAPIRKDGDLDSDIVWHEYGHGLTWRMIGSMSGPMAGGIGEGMSDVLSVIVNNDPVVGEYSSGSPGGLRRYSYEGYPLNYGNVGFGEVHDTGELYGAIGWDLWKRYKLAGLSRDDLLFDLVQGMNFTPAGPNFQQMRDGILQALNAYNHLGRECKVWNAFATYGVGPAATSTVSGSTVSVTPDFTTKPGC